MLGWGIIAAAVVSVGLFFRWLFKWKDTSWDSEEGQSKAFLWSKRGTGGLGR